MKKIISSFVAGIMLFAMMPMTLAAEPANLKELVKLVKDEEIFEASHNVFASAKVRENGETEYSDSLSLHKAKAATTVDFEAVLDTKGLKEIYQMYISKAESIIEKKGGANKDDLLAELEATTVTGDIEVKVTVPTGVILPDDSKITFSGDAYAIYEEVEREYKNGIYTIKLKVAGKESGGVRPGCVTKAELDTAFDGELKLTCEGATINNFGKYVVLGEIMVTTNIGDNPETQTDESYAKATFNATEEDYSEIETMVEITKKASPRPDPTPIIPSEPDTPPALNDENHFAYIVGYSDGLVRPEAHITRAEVATIFYRLLKEDVRNQNTTRTNNFLDVQEGTWYNNAISTMAKLNIVKGYPNGSFGPNDSVTRAEFAAIAARFDSSTAQNPSGFNDIAGHWAEGEINKAAEKGWVNGYTDGSFKPDKLITRAEAAALINRVLNRNPETADDLLPDMIKWADNSNTGAWYYLDIQEATNSHDYERKDNGRERWTKINAAYDWTILEK